MTRAKQNFVEPEVSFDTPGESRSAILDDGERKHRIAEAAYYKAEKRGFEPGYEVEDWIEAESELGNTAVFESADTHRQAY